MRRKKTLLLSLFVPTLFLIISVCDTNHSIAAWDESKIFSSDPSVGDSFGYSVSIDGNTAIVGALGGSYIFVNDEGDWTEQAKLLPSDCGNEDFFGASVAIDEDTVVVGNPFDHVEGMVSQGSAFVYVRMGDAWQEQFKLLASDGSYGDYFGMSVAISGDTIVVGSVGSGSAYVFVRSGDTWTEQAKLSGVSVSGVNQFGEAVAISGDTIVVGDWGESDLEDCCAGAAYVFVRSGTEWGQEAKLIADDRWPWRKFGSSIDVRGDILLVGAPTVYDYGAAYIFERNNGNWTQKSKLTANDYWRARNLGKSVSLDGGKALLGTYTDLYAGSAYLFGQSDGIWGQVDKLEPTDGASGDHFGSSVGMSGEMILVGAWGDDDNGEDSGSAYVYFSYENLPPIADAGENKYVIVWEPVILDGSGSSDPNGDILSYSWELIAKPEGSSTTINNSEFELASLTPDLDGLYSVSLTVNDGILDSEPSNIMISANYINDVLVSELNELIEEINKINKEYFINKNSKNTLVKKVVSVIELINLLNYEEALLKMENDILKRTDGCYDIGHVDNNDWIVDCDSQVNFYDQAIQIISIINKAMNMAN